METAQETFEEFYANLHLTDPSLPEEEKLRMAFKAGASFIARKVVHEDIFYAVANANKAVQDL